MANKAQLLLDFPVRKSSRRTTNQTDKNKDKDISSPRRCLRSDKLAAITPTRGSRSKKFEELKDASPMSKSPCKRKPASVAIPPTPPKSPCKSSQSTATRSRLPSIEISSEESGEESDEELTTVCRVKPDCANVQSRKPANDSAEPDVLSRKLLMTYSQIRNKMLPSSSLHGQRSPSKRKCQTVPPPPTPPKTPYKDPGQNCLTSRGSASPTVLALTATKPSSEEKLSSPQKQQPSREVLSPTKSQPTEKLSTPQKQTPARHILTPKRTLPKEKLFTPEKQQPPRKVLSPTKTLPKEKLFTTPEKQQQPRKILGPTKTLKEKLFTTPEKQQPPRKLLSPTKTLPKGISPTKTLLKGNEENFVLKSPKKLLSRLHVAKPDGQSYQAAKQSLHTAKPDHLVGRDQEVAEITGFLKTHLDKNSAGSLYISGAPGTGKTAALLHIIDEFKVQYKCQIAYLNCMMVKDVPSVFRRLHSELLGKSTIGRSTVKDMEKLVTSSKHNMILVLDEIDQLDSRNQEVLYRIFEWPFLRDSKLILVGVANALDLTDRILPRLQAKPKCRPKLLHFAPYTRDQITAIINDRLTQAGETVVESSAVQFCARKVSAVAGDMRKALDVCRRAVELAESETRTQTVLKISDCNSPKKSQPAPVKRISVAHISKVMAEVYGSSVQAQQSDGVPLQQKLLVCTLLLVVKTGKFKEVLLGKLHETYCKVCRRQQMTPVDQSEFHSLCVLLEARGVVGIKKAKETRLMKITLRQDEKELEQTLQDRVLVSAILKEGLPK